MAPPANFHAILAALTAHQVRFVLIGGVAMSFHGSSHVTDDIDIYYARDPENWAAIVNALAPNHPYIRGAPKDLPFFWDVRMLRSGLNFTLATDIGAIDLLGEASGAPAFDVLWARAMTVDVQGMSVRVASLDDLIAMKEAAGRPKDQAHLLELRALRNLMQDSGE